jgi:hypothetical protein
VLANIRNNNNFDETIITKMDRRRRRKPTYKTTKSRVSLTSHIYLAIREFLSMTEVADKEGAF